MAQRKISVDKVSRNMLTLILCMRIIKTEQEFIEHFKLNPDSKMVAVNADYANELGYFVAESNEGKNLILKRDSIDAILEKLLARDNKGGGRPVGRPRLEVADPSLLEGRELLRYKNRIWKRQSRERLNRN